MKPRISVVVTAHDRRDYLLQALRSLSVQDIDRDAFEVVIVKNFEDSEADEFADTQGYKHIITSLVSVDEKLYLGYKECKGEIISFLEDDDLYVENRITSLIHIFDNFPDLDYYHNWHTVINSDGKIVRGGVNDTQLNGNLNSLNIYGPETSYQDLYRIVRDRAFFNISSIAVTRALLEKSIENFGRELFGRDYYLFYAAAVLGSKLGIDSRELTMYRLHNTNNWSAEYHSDAPPSHFIGKRLALYEKSRDERDNFLRQVKSVSPNVTATKVLEFEMTCQLLDNLYLSEKPNRREIVGSLFRYIKGCPRSGIELLSLYSLLGAMDMINPKLSSRFYLALIFKIRPFR